MKKITVAASLAMSACVIAGCSTETPRVSESSSVNIIDISGVSSTGSSAGGSDIPVSSYSSYSSISSISSTLPDITVSTSVHSSADTPIKSSAESSEPVEYSSSETSISSVKTEIEPPVSEPQSVPDSSTTVSAAATMTATSSTLSAPTESTTSTVASTSTAASSAEISSGSSSGSETSSIESTTSTGSTSSTESTSSTSSTAESSSSCTSSSEAPVPVEPSGSNSYQTLNYSEVKGMWISYLDIMEMSSGSESEFRGEIAAAYDNCAALGINTVYVHVRSHGDAYYNSDYFPRTKYMSGNYDPLPIMIEEAHRRNLSFQAWINPLRMCAEKDVSRGSGYAVYDWLGSERLVKVGSYYYLNPAYSDVIDVIVKGAAEIVANYDVDGLHIDDYFYPTTEEYFDSGAFYDSGYEHISDFRRANCDRLVSSLYSAVKTANAGAVFGVSCQGNMGNNYNEMYADVEKWCRSSGYLDYIMPQIYFGFDNSTQPFAECVKNWDNLAAKGNVPLIVGITAAKIGSEDVWAGEGRNEWLNDSAILRRQVLTSMEQVSYGGVCLFRYRLLFAPDGNVRTQVENEISDLRSVIG